MSAHTTGPWEWMGSNLVGGDYAKTKTCILDFGCGCCKCDETTEADARLIAAAPDLLDALQTLLNDQRDASLPVLSKAREAVAKATGGYLSCM